MEKITRLEQWELKSLIFSEPDQSDIFIILDAALLDEIGDKPEFFPADGWEFLLQGTAFQKYNLQGGILARVPKDSPWLGWFFTSQAAQAAILLRSKFSLKELVGHFRKMAAASLPDQDKKFLFRFYDPRNLEAILTSFTDDEYQKFMGPVSILYWREEKTGYYLKAFNQTPVLQGDISHWLLSKATEAALTKRVESRWPIQMIDALKSGGLFCWFKSFSPSAALAFTTQAVADAKEHGLTEQYQANNWAELQLKYGRNFKNDPQYPWSGIYPKDETPPEMLSRLNAMVDEYEYMSLYGVEPYSDETHSYPK